MPLPTSTAETPEESAPIQRDAALMAQVARGDEAAFNALYQRSYGLSFRVAFGVLLDRAEAREVVQDCFLDLLLLAPRWQPRGTVDAWLTRSAARKALRRRSRLWRLFSTHHAPAWSPPDPDEALIGSRAGRRLEEALTRLSPKQRAVLTLHVDQGLAPSQIAALLGMSAGAARVTLHRARTTLSEELD
ncbi:MAG: RNA polymerase sigma factor [Alphaproteobacteria bacterium]|nr:RNA polymerase sigma factor [Alphaproteobacteria bacterium]